MKEEEAKEDKKKNTEEPNSRLEFGEAAQALAQFLNQLRVEERGVSTSYPVGKAGATVEPWVRYRGDKGAGVNVRIPFAGGGIVKKLVKSAARKQLDGLPRDESAANLERLLEPSAVKERLYHGTRATEKGGSEALRRLKPSKDGALGSGSYLTPATSRASNYAGSPNDKGFQEMLDSDYMKKEANDILGHRAAGEVLPGQVGGNVLPVYAQIKNPLKITGAHADPMVEALMKLGVEEAKASRMVEKAYEVKGYIGKEVQSRAQAQGYDGLMQYRGGELAEVVSYRPSGIKSAIGNRGTYDTSVDDLGMAAGGMMEKAKVLGDDTWKFIKENMSPTDAAAFFMKLRSGVGIAALGYAGGLNEGEDEEVRKMKERASREAPQGFAGGGLLKLGKSGAKKLLNELPTENVAADAKTLYHVTHSSKVDKIRKEGLLPMQTSNWVKAGDKSRYGKGDIFAFDNPEDAARWAGKMDWDLNKKLGSGNISIFGIKPSATSRWVEDTADPISQVGAKGKWVKQMGKVTPEELVESVPFTSDLLKGWTGFAGGGLISRLRQATKKTQGDYGARRVDRAADEIPNLEKLYTEEALQDVFTDDNALLMTMNPADFEKYARRLLNFGPNLGASRRNIDQLKQVGPFNEVPFLLGKENPSRSALMLKALRGGPKEFFSSIKTSKEESLPYIHSHEGRHRSRAMAERGDPAALVRFTPLDETRSIVDEDASSRSTQELIDTLTKKLGEKRLILPEFQSYGEGQRKALRLPEVYAGGGEVTSDDLVLEERGM